MDLVQAAIRAADPYAAVLRSVKRQGRILHVGERDYDLSRYRRILVLGAGKASASMALALEKVLGELIHTGLVVVKYGYTAPTRKVLLREAGHPIPDRQGVAAARELVNLASQADADDLVIALVSGGGSSLLTLPAEGITLEDKRAITDLLLRSGAAIGEVNTVRKHISQIKGGRLAELIHPAESISLVVSDVVGDPLEVIASGPLVPDPTTFAQALAVLDRRGILDRAPRSIVDHLQRGSAGRIEDTRKPWDEVFDKTYTVIVCSNRIASQALVGRAGELGCNAMLLTAFLEGEAREVGKVIGSLAREIVRDDFSLSRPACLALGGETTVTVTGTGLGGRNQELALSAAGSIDGLRDVAVVSFGTDGSDGPTDSAGAIADGTTCDRGRLRGLNWQQYLANNDSYHFFHALGDLVVTGPTNTNVNDISFVVAL